jgi:hypothetical protein
VAIFGLAFVAYGFVAGPLGPALSGYLLDATGDKMNYNCELDEVFSIVVLPLSQTIDRGFWFSPSSSS